MKINKKIRVIIVRKIEMKKKQQVLTKGKKMFKQNFKPLSVTV